MLLWCNDTVDAREQLGYVMLTLYQISLRRHENHSVQAFVHIRSVILVRISVTERTCASPIVNKKNFKKSGANFPHLQPMAELRRNKRGEIGRQHVKAHSCSHVSPCVDRGVARIFQRGGGGVTEATHQIVMSTSTYCTTYYRGMKAHVN